MEKELLQQKYLTPMELQKLLRVPYDTALKYAHDIQDEMKEKGYLIPATRRVLVLTSIVKKKFGL